MNIYSIPPLICSVFALGLGIFVLLKSVRSPINRVFALLYFETFVWQFCWFLSYMFPLDISKDILSRIAWSTIVFVPFTYYQIIILFLKLSFKKNYLFYGYVFGGFFLILIWTSNLFIAGFWDFWWGSYAKAGPLYPIYLLGAFFFLGRGMVLMLQALKSKRYPLADQNRIKFMVLALSFYFFATIEYAIDFGIPLYPIGTFLFIISCVIITYAIFRHRLMDIRVVIKKTVIYSILTAVLTAIAMSIIFLGEVLLRGIIGYASVWLTILSIFVISLVFQWLRDKIQVMVDRLFYKGKYDYKEAVGELSRMSASAKSLDELLGMVKTNVLEVFKAKECSVFVLDKGKKRFSRK